jgi:lipopolysaccharide export system permease protein
MTSLLSRLSRPMGTLVMPLLGAIAGFGVSRQGNQLARASLGAALGFGYFVAENLMLALGKLGVVPPMIGAFFPFSMALVVGFSILLAMEN